MSLARQILIVKRFVTIYFRLTGACAQSCEVKNSKLGQGSLVFHLGPI